MELTWRWFGPNDRITLQMLRQIGVEGIVSALHHLPNGAVWEYEEICTYRDSIENAGMRWSVVESLPVSEAIKYGGPNRDALIDNYITSLNNLGRAGIHTVCYNFMPVIDWIRTDLHHPLPDGTATLFFDKVRFAYFDIYILNRQGARSDYSEQELSKVDALNLTITEAERQQLIHTIIVKTQGFINGNIREGDAHPVKIFNSLLALYNGIDRDALRDHLRYFLQRIMPVCRKWNINMCIHPDDPPFPVLGLPRIVGNADDIRWILSSVDDPHNGLTFCSGSLSAGAHNDVCSLAQEFAQRTHFLHLRSTDVDPSTGNFIEASHLGGRGHITELIRLFEQKHPGLPMRVDHGKLMLDDSDKPDNPGYSFLGRMYALAQVSGMLAMAKQEAVQ